MTVFKRKFTVSKIPLVLQHHVPHKKTYPPKYFHDLLFMYFPFRNDSEMRQN